MSHSPLCRLLTPCILAGLSFACSDSASEGDDWWADRDGGATGGSSGTGGSPGTGGTGASWPGDSGAAGTGVVTDGGWPNAGGAAGTGGDGGVAGDSGSAGAAGEAGGAGAGGGSTSLPDPSFIYGYFTLGDTETSDEVFLPELEGHSNVVLGSSTVSFIQEAKARGIKPIVWVSRVVWLWELVGDGLKLRSDFQSLWDTYAQYIAPYIDDIYAFYPADEPYWAAKLSTADQNALNSAIKASFPNKPIMTTFARPTIEGQNFIVPSTYDYVGYDNYYGESFASDEYYYQVLKSKLSPGQKIFLIGDGFANDHTASQAEQELKANKIQLAYQLATTPGEPIVGILSFVWDSYSDNWPYPGGTPYLGIRDMPSAKSGFVSVGQYVLANN
jgi:hypothetical protein